LRVSLNIHNMIKTCDDSIFPTQDADTLKGGVLHRKETLQHLVDSTSEEDRRMFQRRVAAAGQIIIKRTP